MLRGGQMPWQRQQAGLRTCVALRTKCIHFTSAAQSRVGMTTLPLTPSPPMPPLALAVCVVVAAGRGRKLRQRHGSPRLLYHDHANVTLSSTSSAAHGGGLSCLSFDHQSGWFPTAASPSRRHHRRRPRLRTAPRSAQRVPASRRRWIMPAQQKKSHHAADSG